MSDFEFNALSPTEIEIVEQPRLRPGRHKEYQREFREERGCYFLNQTLDKEAIPPYALFQPKDRDDEGCIVTAGNRPLVRAIKRNDEPCDLFYVNGPNQVEYGKGGRCMTLMADIPTRVMLDQDLDPAMHDCLGPVEDEWHLGATGIGFLWLAMHPDEDDTAWVQRGVQPGAVIFKNNDASTAPKFGVGRISGETEVGGNTVTTIVKPDTTFSQEYLIVGPRDVAAGKYGLGYLMDGSKRRVLYDTGTPAYGEGWGPKPGQWSLSRGFYGYRIFGNNDTENTTTMAKGLPIERVFGKLDAALGDGETETFSIFSTAGGTEADTTMNITGKDWFMKSGATDIASGTKGKLDWMGNAWYFTLFTCQ